MRRLARLAPRATRTYNFASSQYNAAFEALPPVDRDTLRRDALAYVERFDARSWYDDPVATHVGGRRMPGGDEGKTFDNFGRENGRVRTATEPEVQALIDHLTRPHAQLDLRTQIREVEQVLFTEHAAALIGNQTLDFGKQDGVTEVEEALETSAVERRLVDQLLEDEGRGVVHVERAPVLVACVSNFSNFLDLSRKTLRHLECGAPVVVLGRTHDTTQYPYRWYRLLAEELERHGLQGYASFAACDLEQQVRLCRALGNKSPLHITASRQTALHCNETHGNVIASTGGPNTMVVAGALDDGTGALLRDSATIEHAGQCTALRVAVLDARHQTPEHVSTMARQALCGAAAPVSAADALSTDVFAGLFDFAPANSPSFGEWRGYVDCDRVKVRVREDSMPLGRLDEGWRMPVVDLNVATDFGSDAHVSDLVDWLVKRQPISLAVNGDLALGLELWESTALVVVTVGGGARPAASTCQARPQDGEIFGEVPPRKELRDHSRFPVIVPSAAPAYNASYRDEYLRKRGEAPFPASVSALVARVEDPLIKGYCAVLVEYLQDACGPRTGPGKARETLYGLQRPPLHLQTAFRLDASTKLDDVAAAMMPFLLTNARDQLVLSVAPGGEALAEVLASCGVDARVEANFEGAAYYDVVEGPELRDRCASYSLAQQFVSLYLPLGHVKSTLPSDEAFVEAFSASRKWLRVVDLLVFGGKYLVGRAPEAELILSKQVSLQSTVSDL